MGTAPPTLVVGLGNPGPEYRDTRHNIGATLLRALGDHLRIVNWRARFKGAFAEAERDGRHLCLLFPETYMNLSGESVARAVAKLEVPLERVIVCHDEVDLPFGVVKVKVGGGTSGHRGLRSLVQHLGSADFVRLRLGIGRPPVDMIEHVLGCFDPAEQDAIPEILQKSTTIMDAILNNGPTYAMNAFNGPRG